jgi:hypothetical protein
LSHQLYACGSCYAIHGSYYGHSTIRYRNHQVVHLLEHLMTIFLPLRKLNFLFHWSEQARKLMVSRWNQVHKPSQIKEKRETLGYLIKQWPNSIFLQLWIVTDMATKFTLMLC